MVIFSVTAYPTSHDPSHIQINMVSFKNLIFLTTAVTAASLPLQKRLTTITTVEKDVTAIDTGVKALIAATSAYTGGLAGSAPMLADLGAVYTALYKGVIDSGLLPPSISSTDSFALINLVNSTLAIDNPIAIDTLISKKAYFQEQGLDGVIVGAIELLKAGHDAFSANVLERVPADAVEPAMEVVEVIDEALQKGIDAFEATN